MTRIGFAGDAYPEINIPSYYLQDDSNFRFGSSELLKRPNDQIHSFYDQNYDINEGEYLKRLFEYSQNQFLYEPSEMTALFTQPAHKVMNSNYGDRYRRMITEQAIETYGYSGISFSSDSTLASYAHCFETATVIDFGWSCLRIVPVVEGKPVYSAITIHIGGGSVLSEILTGNLHEIGLKLIPEGKHYSKIQSSIVQNQVASDMILQACYYYSKNQDSEQSEHIAYLDTRIVDLSKEMKFLSEILWITKEGGDQIVSLPALVEKSIGQAPDSFKKSLWRNIVTCGGFSQLSGFQAKLQEELTLNSTNMFEKCVNYPMSEIDQANFAVWVGGSILGSSHVFPRYVVNKSSWEEHGDIILSKLTK